MELEKLVLCFVFFILKKGNKHNYKLSFLPVFFLITIILCQFILVVSVHTKKLSWVMATVKLRTKANMLRCSAHSFLIFKSHLNETHGKWTFSKSMWKSSSVKESICINYSTPLEFSLLKNLSPRLILSSYQFHCIYLANTHKFSIIFCGRKNLRHLVSTGTVAEFTRRAWGLPGTFLLSPFSRNLLSIYQTLQYHSLKYNLKSV